MTRFRRSWPWWRRVLTGLSALALALSGYLGWHYLAGGPVIGCGGGSPCDQVLNSRWSTIGGVLPVSGLAAGAYLAMLAASLCIGPGTEAPVRRLAWRAMLVLVGAAAGSAVWFTIVQEWMIGAFCPWCMTTHITGLLLAALVIWRAPRQFDDDSTEVAPTKAECARPRAQQHESANRLWKAGSCQDSPGLLRPRTGALRCSLSRSLGRIGLFPGAGLALAGLMAASQAAFTPKAVYRGGESQNEPVALDPRAVPLVGSTDAVYVVTLLFDYKCPHCQELHFMLDEAIRRYGGKLAFALCPTPLNTNCNPYIPRNVDEFADSCELAKVGLAVWVAKREAFPAFNRWMFSFESGDRWRPRSLEAAKAKAVELVGPAKFDAAQADPWIARHLQTSIRIYSNTLQGGNAVPKLVFGSRWVIPEPYDADGLVSVLHDSLAVPRP